MTLYFSTNNFDPVFNCQCLLSHWHFDFSSSSGLWQDQAVCHWDQETSICGGDYGRILWLSGDQHWYSRGCWRSLHLWRPLHYPRSDSKTKKQTSVRCFFPFVDNVHSFMSFNYVAFWQTNVQHLTEKMKKDIQRGLVLRYSNTHFQPYTDSHAMLAAEANNP